MKNKFLVALYLGSAALAVGAFLAGLWVNSDDPIRVETSKARAPESRSPSAISPKAQDAERPLTKDDGSIDSYLSSIVEGVLATDREVAFSLTAGLDADVRGKGIEAIGEALQFDPEGMVAWADHAISNPDRSYGEYVLSKIAGGTKDGRVFAEWMERNPDAPYGATEVSMVARKWAENDPLAALDWVNGSSDSRIRGRLGEVVSEWSRTDLEAATAWTVANMDDPRIVDALPHVVGGLAQTDAAAAADWVGQLDPELVTPSMLVSVVDPWVKEAPEEALRWVESLSDEGWQNSAIYSAASNWPADRLEEFNAWLSSAGAGGSLDNARRRFSYRFFDEDPFRALEIAGEIADVGERENATVDVARRLITKEPEAVRRWLPESGLSEEAQVDIRAADPKL